MAPRPVVGIHQPHYLPWLGYLDKVDRSDIFILYDMAQFSYGDWQNRNYIKGCNGPIMLTAPVEKRHSKPIKDTRLSVERRWISKHLKNIQASYQKAPFFDRYFQGYRDIVQGEYTSLAGLAESMLLYLIEAFGIQSKIVRSSDISGLEEDMSPGQKLAHLVFQVGGRLYLSGPDGKKYLQGDLTYFDELSIEVIYQEFSHPLYNQLWGAFVPKMTALDLLFNHGPESIEILRKARIYP
jgi:hypothetical protein